MSLPQIHQLSTQLAAGLDRSLLFQADRGFISTLTLGQIIKGKVLRHHEGGRYSVSFGNQERVVDSAIPLKTGEVIHGRVVGLGEQVRLERVFPESQLRAPVLEPPGGPQAQQESTQQLFDRHQARLSPQELRVLRSIARGGDTPTVATSALILRKIGLNLDPRLIQAIAKALTERGFARRFSADEVTTLAADRTQPTDDNGSATRLLAAALDRISNDAGVFEAGRPAVDPDAGGTPVVTGQSADGDEQRGRDRRDQREWLLGRWLLNTQGEGSIAHRLLSVPMLIGDRLVEMDIGFFDQKEHAEESDTRFRRIVFSLDLETLGRLEVTVTVSDRRITVRFDSEREATTQVLAAYLGWLKSDLLNRDWQLDQVTYGTIEEATMSAPARSVAEHYIRQDSLSRLF